MLVLSRRIGEKLVIGDEITVTINRVAGNRVSLGIEAPPHVRVVRSELRQALLDILTAEVHQPSDDRAGESDSHSGNEASETVLLTASLACR
ncbi:MAG TPA: carbon storage regulator [Pirellulales bacterium]|nr:carbon storage regulator [Pirellulales bacterium]